MSLQIFVPLLSNPTTQNAWAGPVTQDLKEHIHRLKSTVYQVKGRVSGQTILPLPKEFTSEIESSASIMSRWV